MTLEELDNDNVHSHSLLNQNFLVDSLFQFTAPDSSSLASLGVGLGVRDSREASPTFGSNGDLEFNGPSSLDGGYNVVVELCTGMS
jgi:hypothetical protein